MPKYRISYKTEDWWLLDVEAIDMDEAINRFHHDFHQGLIDYDSKNAILIESGSLQDEVDIYRLEK